MCEVATLERKFMVIFTGMIAFEMFVAIMFVQKFTEGKIFFILTMLDKMSNKCRNFEQLMQLRLKNQYRRNQEI
jgi:hypothetical protein